MVLSVVALCLTLTAILVTYLSVTDTERSVWLVACLAFALRLGFAATNEVLGLFKPTDENGYHLALQYVAEAWRSGSFVEPLAVGTGPGISTLFGKVYSLLFGPVYALFGTDTILIRLTMALIGTLVVVQLYLIGRELHSHRGGLYTAGIAAVFPYWVYLSGILYRDMLILFFLTLMFSGLLRLQRRETDWPALLLVVICGLFALTLRLENVVAVGAMAVVVVYTRTDEDTRRPLAVVGVVLGSFALIAAALAGAIPIERLASQRLWLARESGGAYLSGFAYGSSLELFTFLPIGALYFTFVPFPWQTPNTMALVALGQNLFLWYPVALVAVLGVRDALHSKDGWRQTLPLLAFAVAGIAAYGLVEGNIGPAMRHRAQFQWVVFLLAGSALASRVRFRNPFSR